MALTCCVSCKQFRDSSNRKLLAFSVELLSIIVNKTSKTLYTRIWVNKAFFTPFNYFSELKNFFLAKLLMSYLKYYISLVSYQKSEKSNDWLLRNAKKCLFFTPISPFLAKKKLFSKIRLHQSLGAVKSYLDTKNQKILMSRSSGIFRTN